MAARIRKGDEIIVTSGRDKGKVGSVLRVLGKQERVVVQGVHVAKKHQKQTQTEQGGVVSKEASISISNVTLKDPEDGKPTRVGFRKLDDGRKVRYAKRSGEVID